MRLFFFTICIFFSYLTYGQDFTSTYFETEDIETKIEHALSPLDMSPVYSGILQDRTIPLGNPDLWVDGNASDSIFCHMRQLAIQYGGMLAAQLPSTSPLESAESAFQNAWDSYTPSNSVPIRLMSFEYHRFYPDAVTSGKLTINGDQLFHGTGYSAADAYEERSLYHSGFFTNTWEMNTDLILDGSSLIGNLSINPNSIYIDVDDGNGFQQMSIGTPFSTSFSQAGEYLVKLKFKDVDNNGREGSTPSSGTIKHIS